MPGLLSILNIGDTITNRAKNIIKKHEIIDAQ
jgi:hypothetical protein